MKVGKYIIKPGTGPDGTVYYLFDTELNKNVSGSWEFMTGAIFEVFRLTGIYA